ncbi:hypothetical protein THAOC_22358 [Thalassiosira oceanica]|uniref:Uncharacterized protein n=1 Tax=Thalassiosira oceanica TaxID=159749 RepID=K0RUQ8_THAOC|nr:hypothetical protein THAOC_22358 [Thalassiosira oceanica]|eukprot:EJK57583.1 hypothetical protein THAOC_22358 [Thalassiosira oceanica]
MSSIEVPTRETAIRVGFSDGANLGSRSVFQSTSMAPTSSEIYILPSGKSCTSVKPPFGQRVKFDVLPDNDFGSRVTRLRGAVGKTGARDRKRVSLASFCLTGGPDRWRIDGAL